MKNFTFHSNTVLVFFTGIINWIMNLIKWFCKWTKCDCFRIINKAAKCYSKKKRQYNGHLCR